MGNSHTNKEAKVSEGSHTDSGGSGSIVNTGDIFSKTEWSRSEIPEGLTIESYSYTRCIEFFGQAYIKDLYNKFKSMPSEKLMSAPRLFSAARLQLFGEATLMDLIRILVVFETMSGGDDVALFIDESIPKFYGTPEFPRNMFSGLGGLAHQLGRKLAPQSTQDASLLDLFELIIGSPFKSTSVHCIEINIMACHAMGALRRAIDAHSEFGDPEDDQRFADTLYQEFLKAPILRVEGDRHPKMVFSTGIVLILDSESEEAFVSNPRGYLAGNMHCKQSFLEAQLNHVKCSPISTKHTFPLAKAIIVSGVTISAGDLYAKQILLGMLSEQSRSSIVVLDDSTITMGYINCDEQFASLFKDIGIDSDESRLKKLTLHKNVHRALGHIGHIVVSSEPIIFPVNGRLGTSVLELKLIGGGILNAWLPLHDQHQQWQRSCVDQVKSEMSGVIEILTNTLADFLARMAFFMKEILQSEKAVQAEVCKRFVKRIKCELTRFLVPDKSGYRGILNVLFTSGDASSVFINIFTDMIRAHRALFARLLPSEIIDSEHAQKINDDVYAFGVEQLFSKVLQNLHTLFRVPENIGATLSAIFNDLITRSGQDIFSFISQCSDATSLLGDMFMNVLLGTSVSMIQKYKEENDHEQVNAWTEMSQECYVEWTVNMDTFSSFNEHDLVVYSYRLNAPAFKKEESVDSDEESVDSDAATGVTDFFKSGIFQSPTSGLPSGDNSVNHAMYDNKM